MRLSIVADIHTHERARDQHKDLIREMSQDSDVILLPGDLTDLGLPAEAQNLAQDLKEAKVPVCAVLGNHDIHSEKEVEVRNILADAGVHFLDEEAFVQGDVGIVGIKGFGGGFDRHMLAAFGERMDKTYVNESVRSALKLEHLIQGLETPKKVVVLHYSPIRSTIEGEHPEIYPFLGTSRLEETIDRFDVNVVFHGHAHHGSHVGTTKKGIPVFNVSRTVLGKAGVLFMRHEI